MVLCVAGLIGLTSVGQVSTPPVQWPQPFVVETKQVAKAEDFGRVDLAKATARARDLFIQAALGNGSGEVPAWIEKSQPWPRIWQRQDMVELFFANGVVQFRRSDGSLHSMYINPLPNQATEISEAACRQVVLGLLRDVGYRQEFDCPEEGVSRGEDRYVFTFVPRVGSVQYDGPVVRCCIDPKGGAISSMTFPKIPPPPASMTPGISRLAASSRMLEAVRAFRPVGTVEASMPVLRLSAPRYMNVSHRLSPRHAAIQKAGKVMLTYVGSVVDKEEAKRGKFSGRYIVRIDALTGETLSIIPLAEVML